MAVHFVLDWQICAHTLAFLLILWLFNKIRIRDKDWSNFTAEIGTDVSDLKQASEIQTSKLTGLNAAFGDVMIMQNELESRVSLVEQRIED